MKEMAKAADSSAREIRSVAKGNQQHSKGAAKLVAQLADIRRITERNAEGVGRTRGGTADLMKQARALTGLMDTKPKADRRTAATAGDATAMHTAPTLGVVTTDRHLAVRGWNEWVAVATGLPEAGVVGRPLLDFVAPRARGLLPRPLRRGARPAASRASLAPAFHHYLIAVPAARAVGALRRTCSSASPSRRCWPTPTSVGVMITLEDVTERLDRERSLAALLEQPAPPARRTDGARVRRLAGARPGGAPSQAIGVGRRDAAPVRHAAARSPRPQRPEQRLAGADRRRPRRRRAAGRSCCRTRRANLRMHAALALGELQRAGSHAGAGHDARRSGRERPLPRHRSARPHRRRRIDRRRWRRSPPPTISSWRFAAIEALSKTDDARVAPLMVSLLDQELLRPAAIATLAAIGDEDCVPALARALNQAGSDAGPIASALAAIHRALRRRPRRRQLHRRGARRHAVTAAGRDQLVAAVARDDADRVAAATVLGWLAAPRSTRWSRCVGEADLQAAIGDGIVADRHRRGAAADRAARARQSRSARDRRRARCSADIGDRRARRAAGGRARRCRCRRGRRRGRGASAVSATPPRSTA